jgi:hypothetical protein
MSPISASGTCGDGVVNHSIGSEELPVGVPSKVVNCIAVSRQKVFNLETIRDVLNRERQICSPP